MYEQEFDSLFQRPFGREDAMRFDARFRGCATLAVALWGRTLDDLLRQLLAPHAAIPSGITLADFRELLPVAQRMSVSLSDPQFVWVVASLSPAIFVGTERYTAWEARCEVLRPATEYLETR